MSSGTLGRLLKVRIDNSRPEQRTGSRMVFCAKQNALFIFGGQNRAAQTMNDLWKFDLSSNLWQKL